MVVVGTYFFDEATTGGDFTVTITDPTLNTITDGLQIYPSNMTVTTLIELTQGLSTSGIRLDNIIVNDFDPDWAQLDERIETRLQDFRTDI